jgi:hypothetical protein
MRNRHPSQTVERALLPPYEWPQKGHTAGSSRDPAQFVIVTSVHRVTSSTFCHLLLLCVYICGEIPAVLIGVEMLPGPP